MELNEEKLHDLLGKVVTEMGAAGFYTYCINNPRL